MADPQHQEELDALDKLTVSLYRAGFCVAALGLLGWAAALAVPGAPAWGPAAGGLVAVLGVVLSVANLHLYAKAIRWVIGASGWLGLSLMVVSPALPAGAHVVWHAGLGFVFVSLSALALKERFCFRIPGLRLVPLFLAGSLIPMLATNDLAAAVLLGLAGAVVGMLAVAKLRMPLHFDIGDRSRYQI